jgi:hypothetical protein
MGADVTLGAVVSSSGGDELPVVATTFGFGAWSIDFDEDLGGAPTLCGAPPVEEFNDGCVRGIGG